MAEARTRLVYPAPVGVVGALFGVLFALLLAHAVEIAGTVAKLVLVAAAIAAGVGIASIVSGIARRVSSGSSRSVPGVLALAATGGFTGFLVGQLLGPLTGEARIDGSHIKTATLTVLLAGFGWFAGFAMAILLMRRAPGPVAAWVLRGAAVAVVIAGFLVARWVPSLDAPPPDTTLIPLQRAIRLDAVLAAVTLLGLAQRRVLRRTMIALSMVASILILAATAGRFPAPPTVIRDLVVVRDALFFAVDAGDGSELWRSDGTAAGTTRVVEPVGSAGSRITGMTESGDILFFAVSTIDSSQVWSSDGTEAGTVLVKEFGGGTGELHLTEVDGIVYFASGNGSGGRELWKTDVGRSDAELVKAFDTRIGVLRNDGGTLLLRVWGSDPSGESRAWKSDGTEAGTVLVEPSFHRPRRGRPAPRETIGGTVFFVARDAEHGRALWKRTDAGTTLVKDIRPGVFGSEPSDLTGVGDTLYFRVGSGPVGELWKSDGTAAGTVFVEDVALVREWEGGSGPTDLTSLGGTLFFIASDGFSGVQLWRSDGTGAGTVPVKAWPEPGWMGLAA